MAVQAKPLFGRYTDAELIGAELENDLVEAAARSPLGVAIDDLPAHLRALATERRSALLKGHMSREDEPTRIEASPSSNA